MAVSDLVQRGALETRKRRQREGHTVTPFVLVRRVLGPVLLLMVAACGHDQRQYVARTLSDQSADGDVTWDPSTSAYTITQAVNVGNVIFGVDNSVPALPESRAFLDFPLDGSAGGDAVPANASIVSADVEVFVDAVSSAATVPTLLDLVPFQIPLSPSDFDSSPLTSRSTRALDFFSTDAGTGVRIDVTDLMVEAQAQSVRDFQLRFLLDPNATAGLVQLRDAGAATAPLLTVDYQ